LLLFAHFLIKARDMASLMAQKASSTTLLRRSQRTNTSRRQVVVRAADEAKVGINGEPSDIAPVQQLRDPDVRDHDPRRSSMLRLQRPHQNYRLFVLSQASFAWHCWLLPLAQHRDTLASAVFSDSKCILLGKASVWQAAD
jgi:hypothetical protein